MPLYIKGELNGASSPSLPYIETIVLLKRSWDHRLRFTRTKDYWRLWGKEVQNLFHCWHSGTSELIRSPNSAFQLGENNALFYLVQTLRIQGPRGCHTNCNFFIWNVFYSLNDNQPTCSKTVFFLSLRIACLCLLSSHRSQIWHTMYPGNILQYEMHIFTGPSKFPGNHHELSWLTSMRMEVLESWILKDLLLVNMKLRIVLSRYVTIVLGFLCGLSWICRLLLVGSVLLLLILPIHEHRSPQLLIPSSISFFKDLEFSSYNSISQLYLLQVILLYLMLLWKELFPWYFFNQFVICILEAYWASKYILFLVNFVSSYFTVFID